MNKYCTAYCRLYELCLRFYTREQMAHVIRVEEYVVEDPRFILMTEEEQYLIKMIALAHDLFEDTDCLTNQLVYAVQGYSSDVLIDVACLTRRKYEKESYMAYIKRLAESERLMAIMVKQADLKDHFTEAASLKDSLKKRYLKAAPIIRDAVGSLKGYSITPGRT